MKKSIFLFTLILLIGVALVLSGCSTPVEQGPIDEPDIEENGEEQEEQPWMDESQWPKEKMETIMIEGMEEEIILKRFVHEGISLITYVPEDMMGETVSFGESDSVWFYTNFNGNKNEDAFIRFTFYPVDNEALNIETLAEEYEWNLAESQTEENRFNWSIEEAQIGDDHITGYVARGKYEERYFVMSYQYPWEYGDGFSPRLQKIIDEIYFVGQEVYLNDL
ncbi:hypothetical protein Amet_1685 [Alkaliphilus metalliredigens QYMF]|uniref:Lipoprotein n=1 Tax=Alkaliphilus metalliredigens (strain QYMF) TaxID=293826 RepID=A6TNU4_ALKMQ|nr:hypothetical protein [Alkaliphilus metalliredigens]ABR47862.1 hypothetical protein Amet_1685 [Alkaliphilus metalliredigens QYMF]